MVRIFVYDADFEDAPYPSEIIEVPVLTGKLFHTYTRAYYALYDGMNVRLEFCHEDNTPFLSCTLCCDGQSDFSRTIVDERRV